MATPGAKALMTDVFLGGRNPPSSTLTIAAVPPMSNSIPRRSWRVDFQCAIALLAPVHTAGKPLAFLACRRIRAISPGW